MINENSILVVVVLYKCRIDESDSIKTLAASIHHGAWNCIDLMIYDNSPEYNDSNIYNDPTFRIHYVPDKNNSGVSRAYNIGADLGQRMKKEYILLLDQDTEVSLSYCSELSKMKSKYPLIVPKLICRGLIISPCRYKWGRGTYLNVEDCVRGINSLKNRNFLNSGSLISISLFKRVGGFDENIPLYFSDFNFFNRLKRIHSTFFLLESTFHHNMASNDESNMKQFVKRFEMYCDGAYRCYKSNLGISLMVLNVLLRAFKLTIKYRTFYFIQIALRRFFAFINSKI